MKNKKQIGTFMVAVSLFAPFYANAALINTSVKADTEGVVNTNFGLNVNAHNQNNQKDNGQDESRGKEGKNNDNNGPHESANADIHANANAAFNRDDNKNTDNKGFFSRWFDGFVNWFHFGSGTSTPVSSIIAFNIQTSHVGTSTVEVTWNTRASTTAEIKYGTDKSNLTSMVADSTATQNHDVTLSGLTPNTQYFVQITSKGSDGSTKVSSVSEFKTKTDATVDTTAPHNLFTTVLGVNNNSATIVWITNEPSSSKVWLSTSANVSTTGEATQSKTDLSYIHEVGLTGLSSTTKYFYKVGSIDASGNLSLSDTNTFTTK